MVTAVAYWSLMGLVIFLFSSQQTVKAWFKKPIFIRKWLVIAIILGVFPALGIFFQNLNLIVEYPLITFYLILFALINPWFEEGYWQGLLLDAGEKLPIWINITYSTIFFVLSHPLMWGVFSIANKSIHMYLSLLLMGVIWSIIRYKTKSLRWSVYSHMLVDIGNLSVFVFLNLYIPHGM